MLLLNNTTLTQTSTSNNRTWSYHQLLRTCGACADVSDLLTLKSFAVKECQPSNLTGVYEIEGICLNRNCFRHMVRLINLHLTMAIGSDHVARPHHIKYASNLKFYL